MNGIIDNKCFENWIKFEYTPQMISLYSFLYSIKDIQDFINFFENDIFNFIFKFQDSITKISNYITNGDVPSFKIGDTRSQFLNFFLTITFFSHNHKSDLIVLNAVNNHILKVHFGMEVCN